MTVIVQRENISGREREEWEEMFEWRKRDWFFPVKSDEKIVFLFLLSCQIRSLNSFLRQNGIWSLSFILISHLYILLIESFILNHTSSSSSSSCQRLTIRNNAVLTNREKKKKTFFFLIKRNPRNTNKRPDTHTCEKSFSWTRAREWETRWIGPGILFIIKLDSIYSLIEQCKIHDVSKMEKLSTRWMCLHRKKMRISNERERRKEKLFSSSHLHDCLRWKKFTLW